MHCIVYIYSALDIVHWQFLPVAEQYCTVSVQFTTLQSSTVQLNALLLAASTRGSENVLRCCSALPLLQFTALLL